MSGLCGWFSREPAALPIGQMAAPLARGDAGALRCVSHALGAAAVAGAPGGGGLLHADGVLIAHRGQRAEALARLWRIHGVKACAALSGQFSFAILDERRGEALLAVDRHATHALFYQLVGRTLVFASSEEALLQHPGCGREIDAQALYDYLYYHAVPGALHHGPRRLAPGEYVHLHGGRLERVRYWRLRFQEHQDGNAPGLKAELLDTLRGAVESSLGQHDAGVMLGGGPGSAALAGLVSAAAGARVPSFTVGVGPAARATLDEARRVARAIGTEHHERVIGASEAADAIPALAAGADLPCGDPGVLPAYYCALLAREAGVARLYAGTGGAELFGRRARYARDLRLSRYERLPSSLRQLVIEPLLFRLAGGVRGGLLAAARASIRLSMQPLPARLRSRVLLESYGPANVLHPDFLAQVDPTGPPAAIEQSWWVAQARSPLNRMIALDLQHRLQLRALPSLATACGLAGVDACLPYLHEAVVALSARIDPHHKLDGDRFIREALRAALPNRAGHGRGRGWMPPVGQWLLADARLRTLAYDSLSGLRQRGLVRADFIDQLLARRLAEDPGRHGRMVWLLMMLELWFAQRRPAGAVWSSPACMHQGEPAS